MSHTFFKNADFDDLANRFSRATLNTPSVTSCWYECDRRTFLMDPPEPLAFHLAIVDTDFDSFLQKRAEFLSLCGMVQSEILGEPYWMHPPIWKSSRGLTTDGVSVPASWVTFSEGPDADVFYERHSEVPSLPRAFWKPLADKGYGFRLPRFNRQRIGHGDRVIRKHPSRPI